MTRSQTKDIIRHIFKTLICALQFLILALIVKNNFTSLLQLYEGEADTMATFAHLFYPAVTAALFFVLWHYYDTIDDRSFDRVCKAPETPKFLHDPAYVLAIVLTVLTVTPLLTMSFVPLFRYLRFGSGATAVSILSALAVAAGGSVLRVSRLNYVWSIQKNLPHSKKSPSAAWRIFCAAAFFVALFLIIRVIDVVAFIFSAILLSFIIPILIIAGLFLLWCFVILPALNIPARRKFMLRLKQLQDEGKLTAEIHGHPYLSLFFERVPFGLTVTNIPHPEAKVQQETVYKAAFANCKRRRELVVICEHNIYQFMYSLKFNHVTRHARMGADKAGVRAVSVPGMSWFTNHSFTFPEGEGERVLLIDSPPTILAVRDEGHSGLFELDNASRVFGYTVYGKNAFLNVMERT